MKKFAVIGVSLLLALAVVAYVFLDGRSADTKDTNEDGPAETRSIPSGVPTPAVHAPEATAEEQDRAVEEAIARIAPENYRHEAIGAQTDFRLFGGEIGYVDVDSILQDRNPYSIVALLQQHRAISGAGDLLELEIESTVETHRGFNADFFQRIGDTPTEARGSVGFDTSGAVYTLSAVLLDPQAAGVDNIVILRAEAEAIAREAAARFVEPYRAPYAARGEPLRMRARPAEFRYALDSGTELRAEWRVLVSTGNPPESLEVLVAAETGEIVGIRSEIVEATAPMACPELSFRVCDGSVVGTDSENWSCDGGVFATVTPVLDGDACVAPEGEENKCSQAQYTTPKDAAVSARDYVKNRGTEYLRGVGGADCRIDILVNVARRDFPPGKKDAAAIYSESVDAILIKDVIFDRTGRVIYPALHEVFTAHELFHAVSKGSGEVEHALVYSMDALYMGGGDDEWNYKGVSIEGDQVIYRGDVPIVVADAIYRIYERIGNAEEVFRFALEVDRKRATSLYGFRQALVEVAEDQFSEAFQQAVAAVLVEMGINDAVAGTVSITMLRFIAAKMRELALILPEDDAAWVRAAAEEAEREIRERLGLDNDQVLRNSRRRGG